MRASRSVPLGLFLALIGLFVFGGAVHAKTFFMMADGRFYDPSSGVTADTESELERLVAMSPEERTAALAAAEAAKQAAQAAQAAAEAVAAQTPPPAPSFFTMADGRWYDPRTGLTAATEQALRDLINPPEQPTTPATSVSLASPLQEFPLVRAIRRGQSLLNETLTQSEKLLPTKPDWAPVRLAVWRSSSDAIDLIDIEKRGTEIRGTDPRIGEVDVLLSRQLQSQYKLASDSDVVVAIRYPLYREVKVKKKTQFEREDVVYSPYSPMLHTEDMVRFGHAWLDREFQLIADDLRSRGVKSRFDPSKPLADMLSSDVTRAILMIEHTDRTSLDQDPGATYARMLVTVAANATTSYAYSDSHVGAQGFAQFMPSTYKLVAKDETLGLPLSVEAGTRQFETAVKAQLVYLDRLWSVMPDTAKTLFSSNPDRAAEYVVAAYNGGETRIQKASVVWGDDWSTPDTSQVKKAQTAVNNATAEVKKAKKAVTAATTAKAKTTANVNLKKAKTTLANAEDRLARLQAGTLRQETIDYVAKFRQALKGIRQVRATIQGVPVPDVSIASIPESTDSVTTSTTTGT